MSVMQTSTIIKMGIWCMR